MNFRWNQDLELTADYFLTQSGTVNYLVKQQFICKFILRKKKSKIKLTYKRQIQIVEVLNDEIDVILADPQFGVPLDAFQRPLGPFRDHPPFHHFSQGRRFRYRPRFDT